MVLSSSEKLVLAFINLIIGIVLISSVATQSLVDTTPIAIGDEALDISSARYGSNDINESFNFNLINAGLKDAGGWVTDSVSITNASGTSISGGNYTVDYSSDVISFINNSYMTSNETAGGTSNDTLVSYKYYQSSYLILSWGRTVIYTAVGLFAIAILLVSVALFFSIAKDYGII